MSSSGVEEVLLWSSKKRKRTTSNDSAASSDGPQKKMTTTTGLEVFGGSAVEECDDEGWFSDQINPLDNHIIASRVLSFLPLGDLKSCRLVNSTWEELSTPLVLSSSRMEIDMSSCPKKGRSPVDYWTSLGGTLLSRSLKLSYVDVNEPNVNRILKKFGNVVEELVVDGRGSADGVYKGHPIKKNFLVQIAQLCPKLKSLELINLPDALVESSFPPLLKTVMANACPTLTTLKFICDSYYCGVTSSFLADLFDFAPNITHLYYSLEDDDALEKVFETFELRRAFMQKINSLSFSPVSVIYDAEAKILMSLEMKLLKELNVTVYGPDGSTRIFASSIDRLPQFLCSSYKQ